MTDNADSKENLNSISDYASALSVFVCRIVDGSQKSFCIDAGVLLSGVISTKDRLFLSKSSFEHAKKNPEVFVALSGRVLGKLKQAQEQRRHAT